MARAYTTTEHGDRFPGPLSSPSGVPSRRLDEGGLSLSGPSMPVAAGAAPTWQPGPDWLTASAEHARRLQGGKQ